MSDQQPRGHGFGTAPVYLAAVSTILGAILFLRFGYAVGHAGMFGAFLIVLIGHAITIPTGLAVAEIATNLKVEGGGEYYIISRSFGPTVGGTIGLSLYMSQAISVAFYMIAFSEAFRPLFGWFQAQTGITPDIRMIGIPATVVLLAVILLKGADIGVSMLWIVVTVLAVSLAMFFLGHPVDPPSEIDWFSKAPNHDSFFKVFAIIFPAFTGMTAGVGLSGDLKNPRKSIPLGTLAGTLTGMVVYLLIIVKMGMSATPEELASDPFIMSKIALWGPIIPIGLGAATISSAIGSILVAPRTLQALANDGILPFESLNRFLAKGKGDANEPFHATLVTAIIVFAFVSMGSVDFVAQIISMFFMVTYGALCSISFLEHFAGNPSYRPTFKSKWYLSMIGGIASFVMMYLMQPLYAAMAFVLIVVVYLMLRRGRDDGGDLSGMVMGVLFQLARKLHVLLQKRHKAARATQWRPSFIALSRHSLTRLAPFDLLRWISQHYGFGTFIHFIKGPLDEERATQANQLLERLIEQTQASDAGLYVDTIVSPSFRTAVAQIVQIPGISGLENNSILFEFHRDDADEEVSHIIDGTRFAAVAGFNICVLRSSERHFGYRRTIHIWLTPGDYRNANLMILLAYIIIGHSEWKDAEIRLFAAFNQEELATGVARLNELIAQGRIPISPNNVQRIPFTKDVPFDELVSAHSETADLVITGFSLTKAQQDRGEFFKKFDKIHDILFVRATQDIVITEDTAD